MTSSYIGILPKLPLSSLLAMTARVSQEFFQAMASPKFSAFGYLKMEFIEKNKIYYI